MSASASGWVWRHSPYRGATFLLHLALGDVANDAHGYELWMSVPNMAHKTRLSERQVHRALRQMESDGHLVVLRRDTGETVHYRFVLPVDNSAGGVTPRQGGGDTVSGVGGDRVSPKLNRPNSTERGGGVSQMRGVQPQRYVPDTTPGDPPPEDVRKELAEHKRRLKR